ncbi:MAG: hypothetical protein M0C28_06450 [Candidatus Moduliflexus flocculans]|nr:hypothetical protein [Candidatus Moduliflexus flocculans]
MRKSKTRTHLDRQGEPAGSRSRACCWKHPMIVPRQFTSPTITLPLRLRADPDAFPPDSVEKLAAALWLAHRSI